MLKLRRCQVPKAPVHADILRWATTVSDSQRTSKPAGDISSVFPSLSGAASEPLPPRFAELKRRLIQGHEDEVKASWQRLLTDLRKETEVIKALGPRVVPELAFRDLNSVEKRTIFRDELRKRGVAVIRGVVTAQEALGWKELAQRHIGNNPSTKGKAILYRFRIKNLFSFGAPSYHK